MMMIASRYSYMEHVVAFMNGLSFATATVPYGVMEVALAVLN